MAWGLPWRVTARERHEQATPPEREEEWAWAGRPTGVKLSVLGSLTQKQQNHFQNNGNKTYLLLHCVKKGRTDKEQTEQQIRGIYTIKTKDPELQELLL